MSTNHYLPYNGGLDETVYGNNDGIKYGYNYSGNVTAIYYKDNANGSNTANYSTNPAFTWHYSSNGTPRVHKDGYTGLRYDYGYDAIGRLIRTDISKSSNGAAVGSTEYGYNTRGHLTSITNDIGGNAYGQYYSYSQTDIDGTLPNAKDGLPTRYRALGVNTDYAYDSLNRLTKRNVDLATDIETLYTYKDSLRGSGYATTQLATEKLGGISYGYNYDNMGNITSIVKGSNAYRSYTYDSLGQLKTETLHDKNQVISYTYNHLGNITAKEVMQYPNSSLSGVFDSDLYEYYYSDDNKDGWNYLLTAYDADANGTIDETEKISYDDIGNPISYRGAAMAWRGRQLTGHTKNGVTSTFSYDADGLRSTKTIGGVKTEYQYVGDQLFYEKRGDSQEFYYFYDSYGNLSKIYYTFINTQNNTTSRAIYHALTNAQGDVIALYNGSGSLVAQYEYDAWGNTLSIKNASGATIDAWYNIAVANPIRYRGYYYDADLGLYYLQSRYYDSTIGRFINADTEISDIGGNVLGNNSFAYCHNNPVNMSDPTGHWPNWSKLVSGIGLAITGMIAVTAAATATCVAAPVVAAVAIAGIACMAMGSSEIVESFNGYNFVRDTVLGGNESAYNTVRTVATVVASVGSGYINSVSSAGGIPTCFVAGTFVLSQFGQVKIEKIKVGDKVWAENPETGEKALKTVVQTFVNESDELIHLFVNDEEIITTPNHPFYVPQKGWVLAVNLRAGDILVLVNGKYVILEQVQHEILENPVTVYNFEVEDFHTYYVGYSSVFVHNSCKPDSPVKVNPNSLKKVDVHAFKQDFVKKNVSHWDVFKDTANNSILWLGNKAQDVWYETGMYIDEVIELFPKR